MCAASKDPPTDRQPSPAHLAGARVRVVVAHFDDEALFCGALLAEMRPVMAHLHVVVVTSVETTSAPREVTAPLPLEIERRRRRVAAFDAVCCDLDAGSSQLHIPNLPQTSTRQDANYQERVRTIWAAVRQTGLFTDADVVITHGFTGEYGHPQHRCVHDAVMSLAGSTGPTEIWTFSASGPADLTYRHDTRAKSRLLDHYRHQKVDGSLWLPEHDPRMREWTGVREWYRIQRVVNDCESPT
ncbi:PIG-L family deacetylase [Streptomyces guryensis]|uniref:PIG-L family deacetylase n=1 Tax=Streptomyces guryensis TaxID=2886947 RepID=A0A9Q3VR78_9ACTN|nr:PIG-L family deacetylase [Streptomyces guryensis]MCD9878583.1 PIG-L family deacetylase [Streptomyces guryensis]